MRARSLCRQAQPRDLKAAQVLGTQSEGDRKNNSGDNVESAHEPSAVFCLDRAEIFNISCSRLESSSCITHLTKKQAATPSTGGNGFRGRPHWRPAPGSRSAAQLSKRCC